MNQKELEARVKRLEDMEEIKKLQRKYQYWLFKQDYEKIVERCFARTTPGVRMEASDSGVFRGPEGVKRFFLQLMGRLRQRPGAFTMHLAVSPVIEVARNGRTAKSVWFSPGCAGDLWVWGAYMVDYVKEEGEWKFWHMIFSPFFRTPYDKGWMEVPVAGTLNIGLQDGPPSRWNPYNRTKKGPELFSHLEDAPEPYDSMEIE